MTVEQTEEERAHILQEAKLYRVKMWRLMNHARGNKNYDKAVYYGALYEEVTQALIVLGEV